MPTRIDASRGRSVAVQASQLGSTRAANIGDMGLGNIGRELDRRSAIRDAKEAERRTAEEGMTIARELGQANLDVAAYLDKAGEAYDGSQPGFSAQAGEDLDRIISDRLGRLSPELHDRIAPRLEGVRSTALMAASDLESSRRDAYVLRETVNTAGVTANAIVSDPSLYGPSMELVSDLAAGAGAQQAPAVQAEIERRYSRAYGEGRIREDAAGFIEELDAGALDEFLIGDDKAVLRRSAETEVARQEREAARVAAENRMYGLITMAPVADDHLASLAATGQGVEGFDEAAFTALLAPREAASFQARLRQANQVYEAMGDLPSLTPREMSERLTDLRPAPGAVGYATDAEIYGDAVRAVQSEQAARMADPVLAASRSSVVSRAYERFQEVDAAADLGEVEPGARIAARETYAAALDAEQEHMGIPPSRRRLLSERDAGAIVAQYEQAADQGRALRDIVLGVSEWGTRSSDVLRELAGAGLPESVMFAADLPQDDIGALSRFTRAQASLSDQEARLSTGDRNTLEEGVWRELSALTDTFQGFPNAAGQANGLAQAAYAVAVDARAHGQSNGAAVRAAAQMFTEQYRFEDTYRIPRTEAEGAVTVQARPNLPLQADAVGGRPSGPLRGRGEVSVPRRDAISRGTYHALDALVADDGVRLYTTEGQDAGTTLGRSRITANGIERNGQWVTAPNDAGLSLVVDRGGILTPVRASSGDPVQFTWADLEQFGRAQMEGASATATYEAIMAAREGRDPNEPTFVPAGGRGRGAGEGVRNWPIVRTWLGDDR